jgi:hypothetical protein
MQVKMKTLNLKEKHLRMRLALGVYLKEFFARDRKAGLLANSLKHYIKREELNTRDLYDIIDDAERAT